MPATATRPTPATALRPILGVALADVRDRVRQPAYAVILLAAVALGWLAVPAAGSHWVILQIGDHRGAYNSAYVGLATALAGSLWLALGGFYVVRGVPARDEASGVGRLLAATPLRTTAYFAGKFLSNVLVLASMLVVLAATALTMQLVRGEDRAVDLGALLLPFAVIALPLMVATAAAALLTDTLPGLRGGLGNVVWFFVWMVLAVGGQGPGAPLGGIGVYGAVRSMHAQVREQAPDARGEFSLGFTYTETPLHTFTWSGFTPDAGYLLSRAAVAGLALVVALLPALWFARFDPARGRIAAASHRTPVATVAPATWAAPIPARPLTAARTGGWPFFRLYAAELRILLQGTRWWWWAMAALLTLTAFAATGNGATRIILPAAWIWPVLLWSRLGTQAPEGGVDALLGAIPRPARRALAEWAAGVTLTAVTGLGPGAVLIREGDTDGLASWTAAVLFVPALALALGTVSRSHRLFQATYLPLWYAAANGMTFLDYMGATRAPGQPATVPPTLLALLAGLLLAGVLTRGAGGRFGWSRRWR
ncbi:hypothetical protein G5C51_22485 [Streptomyces sp. A7024]|uniref:Uncharacterized protein n=2 Tax=Streptomyces coryli TaxID=1128680 RepID=A0A6G4U322_9ACTN|nr:hypothetical protein [Streptomyces coryli]